MHLPYIRHWLIRSRWQRWLFPFLCAMPYLGSLLWVVGRGQLWMAQVMMTPLLMGAVLGSLTAWLAKMEFRTHWRSR